MSTEGYNTNGSAKEGGKYTRSKKKDLWWCFLGVLLLTPPGYYFTQQGHSLKDKDLQQGVLPFSPPSQLLTYKKSKKEAKLNSNREKHQL